jgi:hypothetical protein
VVIWISSFLSENIGALFAGGISGILGWVATHSIAKPISHINELRLQALQLAERNAYLRTTASKERIQAARLAMQDVAVGMRVFARARHGVANLYFRFRAYDLETSARCLSGLMQMVGDDSFKDEHRRDNLDAIYYCLNADKHLTNTRRREIKLMLREGA